MKTPNNIEVPGRRHFVGVFLKVSFTNYVIRKINHVICERHPTIEPNLNTNFQIILMKHK